MTDNRTTELLCKLLEERGIEWKDGDAAYEIEWNTPDGRHCSAMYWKPTFTVLVSGCTPEQAIAATLGAQTAGVAKKIEELRMTSLAFPPNIRRKVNVALSGIEQAIADELNAELGSGTCRIEERNGDWYCDACGEMVGTFDPASELFIDGNAVELWNYCPNCGRKVVSA